MQCEGRSLARHRLQYAAPVHRRQAVTAGAVDGSKTFFDNNLSQHHHFLVEQENDLLDIPHVGKTPVPPDGYEIERIDVVVRLRRKSR